MTTSSAGMNNRMPMKVEETSTNNHTTNNFPASPIVGDTKSRKTSRLQKIRASYSLNKTEHEEVGSSNTKSPLKHLRKKLHKTRRRASTGNKEDPASPSSSTNNTTASHSSAVLEAANSKNNNTNHSSSRFGRVKRSSSAVGSKLRQSLRGSVVKGTAMVMKKEPSLVPDVDKKINKSIASKITASLKHRRSSHGDNSSISKAKDKPPSARERSVSRERTSKMDPSSTGFSSDSYQPASAPTAKKKHKKPGKTKKKSNAALDSTEKQAMALELMLNPSVSYHAASPFHTNSDTEEVPLAGGGGEAHSKKKLKKKKKKKVHRRSQSATLAEPSARSKDDDCDSEDEDDNGPNNSNTNNHTLQPHQPLSQRQQLMRHSQAEWSSEPDLLNQKMTGLEARLANLQKLLTNTSDDTEDEDEEIYDSEEITVASGSDDIIAAAPPPISPTSPSQLKRLTSKGALFHKNGLDSSSSESESESDAEDSATADSFAAGGSSQDGDDFMNSCDFQFFQDDDDKDEDTDDEQDGAGDLLNSGELELVLDPKEHQQPQPSTTTRMDSSDKRFPNAPVTRGRATEPRSAAPKPSMTTTHSTVDPLSPISPSPFPKKRAPPSRVASIDSTGDIGNSDHIVDQEDEEVTMRRSNSRDRPSSRTTPIHEEEVTLRRSNSYDRLARTSGFATLNEDEDEEMVPLNESWRTSSNNHKTWQSESSLPYLQQQANIAFQSESSVPPPKKHNVHPLVSPGRGKRKAFKNPLNAGGDLLQTPLMRNSSAPSSITTSTTTNNSSSSARKPSVAATSHHSPVGRKSLVSATTSSPHGSPPFLRTVVAGANSKQSRRRQRSKSRDRTRVEKSLGRVGLSHETVEDVDEQELLNYLTSGRAERKSLPMGGDQKLPPYATPGRGEHKTLSAASLAKRNRRSGLKRSNSSSDTNSRAVGAKNQNVSVTKTPRTSSTISAESPSSPLLEMQGSLEQLKKVTPPFPTKGGTDDEDILSDDDGENVNDDQGDHCLTLGAVGRRTAHQLRRRQSSSSQLLSDIQQESQEKRHQHHLENRDSLLNVLSAAGDP